MSELLIDPEQITRRRRAAQTIGADGRATPGAATDTTIWASVQPSSGRTLQLLPEGDRQRDPRTIYTTSVLRTADPTTTPPTPADQVQIDGSWYEVQVVPHWRSLDAHVEAVVVRVQE